MRLGGVAIIAVGFLALEIVGMAWVAGKIGLLQMFLGLLLDLLAGVALIRVAGAGFLSELLQAAIRGGDPLRALWSVGRWFVAGILLILPGPFSDLLAVLILLFSGLPGKSPPPPRTSRSSPPQDDVIEGEFRRED